MNINSSILDTNNTNNGYNRCYVIYVGHSTVHN